MAGRVPTKKATRGALHRVPCPHCGRPNDLRVLAAGTAAQQNAGWGGNLVERGTILDCDHCNRKMQIVKVQSVKIVTVRQHNR